MLLGAGAAVAFPREKLNQTAPLKRPQKLGTTFSQLQCRYLGLDDRETFQQICALGFDRIRLCGYWNEIEAVEQQFDFSTLDWLLETSDRAGIEVVLAVGMKVPRWPEFHFPDWLSQRHDTRSTTAPIDANPAIAAHALNFIDQVMQHTRTAPNLKYWQIENEPFTQLEITGGRYLSPEFVRQEVELARSLALPDQKLLLTNAITLPAAQLDEDDRAFQDSLSLADAVGINVYTKVPAGKSAFYLQPLPPYWHKLKQWQEAMTIADRESWIAESQAEPWEPNQLVPTSQAVFPSSSPQKAIHLVSNLTELGFDTVMLWGCEYWYWHKQNHQASWWEAMQQLIAA